MNPRIAAGLLRARAQGYMRSMEVLFTRANILAVKVALAHPLPAPFPAFPLSPLRMDGRDAPPYSGCRPAAQCFEAFSRWPSPAS
jgi:hypothetical protein